MQPLAIIQGVAAAIVAPTALPVRRKKFLLGRRPYWRPSRCVCPAGPTQLTHCLPIEFDRSLGIAYLGQVLRVLGQHLASAGC